jgi:hypothetical protein
MKKTLVLLAIVAVGCESGAAAPPPKTPKTATAQPPPAPPPEEASTWSAPEAHCPSMEHGDGKGPMGEMGGHMGGMGPMGGMGMHREGEKHLELRMAEKNDAKLDVKAGAKGVSLESEGANVGRVLAAIAVASKKAVRVPSQHAWVPIYASVKEKDAAALLDEVAESAGLVLHDKDGELVAEDAGAKHMMELAKKHHEHMMMPIDSRMIPAKHPTEVARVLASTVLSCRGHVTAVPAKGMVVVSDVGPVGERAAQIVEALDASPAKASKWEWAPMRHHHFMPFMEFMHERCMPHGTRAPNGAAGKTWADGTAAGDFLRNFAKSKKEDIVVGCGGDAPAFIVPKPDEKLPQVAGELGFHAQKAGGWLAMPPGMHERMPPMPPPEKIELATVQVAMPHDFAAVASGVVGPEASVEAYEPASMVVVTIPNAHARERFDKLLESWNKK